MRGYAFVDKNNGNVDCVYFWGDDRELPSNCEPASNQVIITVDDIEDVLVDFNYCYDFDTKIFKKKPVITIDNAQISHLDGISNITILYPEQVNDVVKLIIDEESININVANGIVTIPFTSQVIGRHCICVESTTHWGKSNAWVEVI
jgi:hypothetical protein